MEDANIGQSLAHSGTVVVSPDAWNMCSHDIFFGSRIGKTNFIEAVHVSYTVVSYTVNALHICMYKDQLQGLIFHAARDGGPLWF